MAAFGVQIKGQNDDHHIFFLLPGNLKMQYYFTTNRYVYIYIFFNL